MTDALDDGARGHANASPDMFAGDVQTPGQPDAPIRAAVEGVLRTDAVILDHDAKVRIQAVLEQRLAHHPQAAPVLVTWLLPEQHDYATDRKRAERLCTALKAGTSVVALGHGLEAGSHHKEPVFRLLNVVGLGPRTETAAA